MIIVTNGAELAIRLPDDCNAFHVESDRATHALDTLVRHYSAGFTADEHAWIGVSWVRSTIGSNSDYTVSDDWLRRFRRMIDHAHKRGGWTRYPSTYVRI